MANALPQLGYQREKKNHFSVQKHFVISAGLDCVVAL